MQVENNVNKILLVLTLVAVGLLSYLVYLQTTQCNSCCDTKNPIFSGHLLPWRRDVENRLDRLEWDTSVLKDKVKQLENRPKVGNIGTVNGK